MDKKLKATGKKLKAEGKKPKLKPAMKDAQSTPAVGTETTDDSFDFGGLPERSLKKNLGCG